ncbi:predicted protein [Postia placenta Mad-698-R]|nr:predicted protein [Postia placenta Mad-698-R]
MRPPNQLGGVSAPPGGPDQRPGSTQAILETMAQALIVIPPGPLQDAVSEVRKLTRNFHWLQCDEQVEGFLKLCTDVGCAFTRLDRSPGKRLQIDDIIMFLGTNPQFFAYTRIELPEQLVVDENPLYYGGFADVFLARDGTKKLALKKLRISESERHDKRIIRDFSREILCWKFLHHPNINKLVGASLDSFSMLSPWMENGNVPSYIHDTPDVDWIGLLWFGTRRPQMYDKRACLTDFGLSRLMVLVDASAMGLSGMGTCYMMAPELFDPESYARKHAWPTKQTDVYALAMVMFEVMAGYVPWGKESEHRIIYKVISGHRPQRTDPKPYRRHSDVIWKLMERCWDQDWRKRPTTTEILRQLKNVHDVSRRACTQSLLSAADELPAWKWGHRRGCLERMSQRASLSVIVNNGYARFCEAKMRRPPDTGWYERVVVGLNSTRRRPQFTLVQGSKTEGVSANSAVYRVLGTVEQGDGKCFNILTGSIYFTLEYDPTTNGFWKSGHNPRWPYGIELLGLLLMEAPSLKHLCLENFEELLWMHELLGQIVTRFRELTSLTLRVGWGPILTSAALANVTSLLIEGFQAEDLQLETEVEVEDAPILMDSYIRRLEIWLAHLPLCQFVRFFPNVRQFLRDVSDILNKPSLDLAKAKVADIVTCPIKCPMYHLDLDATTDAESKAMPLGRKLATIVQSIHDTSPVVLTVELKSGLPWSCSVQTL